jgi:hypothetical protein
MCCCKDWLKEVHILFYSILSYHNTLLDTLKIVDHSGTTYIEESVLELVHSHKLLLYAQFSTSFVDFYTIVKRTLSGF